MGEGIFKNENKIKYQAPRALDTSSYPRRKSSSVSLLRKITFGESFASRIYRVH